MDNTGIGRPKIIKSVKMLKDALKNHMNFLSMQWPPGPPVQKTDTGMQVRIVVTTVSMPYMLTKTKVAQQESRIERPTKTRRYCRMIDILMEVRAML